MRGPVIWLVIAGGVVAVILAAAAIGGRDESGETVPAGEWAQNVCGAVGVWRGELEAIVEDVRTPNASSTAGGEEPQSETPQGRTGFVRKGLERAIQATETVVEGIDNAGVPDTEQGEEAAEDVSTWAERALDDLEEAQDSLDEEAETIEQSIEQFGDATGAIGAAVVGGVQTITGVAELDPALAVALRGSSTCEQLREESGR
jgi:hypothetical protein